MNGQPDLDAVSTITSLAGYMFRENVGLAPNLRVERAAAQLGDGTDRERVAIDVLRCGR